MFLKVMYFYFFESYLGGMLDVKKKTTFLGFLDPWKESSEEKGEQLCFLVSLLETLKNIKIQWKKYKQIIRYKKISATESHHP